MLAARTVALMSPALCSYYRQHAGDKWDGKEEMRSFQVLGFDVMLDRNFLPYLLEVNNGPSLCIDEAVPLEPGEPGSEERAGRPGRPREMEKVCLCADMAQSHRHQTSLVDLVVKTTVMSGVFQLLEQIQDGATDPEIDCFIPVEVAEEPSYTFLRRVEDLFHRSGGAQKVFTSLAMRRIFAPLTGSLGKGLEKHDLDAISQRYKCTRFRSCESWSRPDALRLFDFLDLLRQVGARAFPNDEARVAVGNILTKLA